MGAMRLPSRSAQLGPIPLLAMPKRHERPEGVSVVLASRKKKPKDGVKKFWYGKMSGYGHLQWIVSFIQQCIIFYGTTRDHVNYHPFGIPLFWVEGTTISIEDSSSSLKTVVHQ